jgi:hypothetical protein
MHSNRNSRNPQQLRSLIQNMGRSVDEARARRLGPNTPAPSPTTGVGRSDGASGTSGAGASSSGGSTSTGSNASPKSHQGSSPSSSSSPPPIRSANEMFVDNGQRLKARPKRSN